MIEIKEKIELAEVKERMLKVGEERQEEKIRGKKFIHHPCCRQRAATSAEALICHPRS